MATKTYKREQGLTIEQLNAIDLLVMGKTDKEVAEAVGVNRVTVTSWRLYDPYFQAELNRRRKEIWGVAVDKFRALLIKALDTIEKALNEGDARTAVDILKMAGLDMTKDGGTLGTYLIGEDDPEAIIKRMAREKEREKLFETIPVTDTDKRNVIDELEELAKKLEALQAKSGP